MDVGAILHSHFFFMILALLLRYNAATLGGDSRICFTWKK
jgi:hypothetical protein